LDARRIGYMQGVHARAVGHGGCRQVAACVLQHFASGLRVALAGCCVPRAAVPLSAPRGAAGHGGAPLRAWCDLLRRDRSARLFASLVVGGCPVRFSRPSPRAQAPNIPNRLGGDAVLAGQPRGQPVARVSPCLFRQEDDDGHLPRDGAIPRLGRQSPTVCAAQVCGPGEGSPWLAGFRGGHSPAGAV